MSAFGAQFLAAPDLFPARMAGETWGPEALEISLAGDAYFLSGLTAGQREGLVARYGLTAAETAAFHLTVYRVAADDFLSIDTRGWELVLDLEPRGSAVAIAGMRLMARLDLERGSGAIWTPVEGADELVGIVENVLRPLVALRLLERGGLLVHSAGVALDERGFLFAGRSGAGKSTLAAIATRSGVPVLSDDLNAVIPHVDGFAIQALPFTGDLSREEIRERPVPLHALIRLEHGSKESARPMSRAAAVALLVASAPHVNRDPDRAERLLDRASEIAAAARRAVLTLRRDGDPWPILRSLP